MLECLNWTLLVLNLVSASWDYMHLFMPFFFQCYDWVQNISPKLLYFMCFWGLPKVSCLSIESKKSTGQHDTVKKTFLHYNAGAMEDCTSMCAQFTVFSWVYMSFTLCYSEFALQVLSTRYSPLSAATAPFGWGLFLCCGSQHLHSSHVLP